jgi:hypothetical protein
LERRAREAQLGKVRAARLGRRCASPVDEHAKQGQREVQASRDPASELLSASPRREHDVEIELALAPGWRLATVAQLGNGAAVGFALVS